MCITDTQIDEMIIPPPPPNTHMQKSRSLLGFNFHSLFDFLKEFF